MTEEEAKTKWCPFVRLAAPVDSEAAGTAGNRYGDDIGGNFRCIASACMAWRVKERSEKRHKRTGQVVPPDAWVVRGDYEEVGVPDGGYCGLAGLPQ